MSRAHVSAMRSSLQATGAGRILPRSNSEDLLVRREKCAARNTVRLLFMYVCVYRRGAKTQHKTFRHSQAQCN